MDLQQLLDHFASVVNAASGAPDAGWTYCACMISRDIHVAVWETRPDFEYVRRRVIPLLGAAERAVRKASPVGHCKDLIPDFADNIAARLGNIENNYLAGKPSAFAPEDRLKDVPDIKITRGELVIPSAAES